MGRSRMVAQQRGTDHRGTDGEQRADDERDVVAARLRGCARMAARLEMRRA
jgi:hypothetical protein